MSETNTGAAPIAADVTGVAPEATASENTELTGTGDFDLGDGAESEVDAIEAAEEAGEITKKEAQSMKKKLKIKVDGEETEMDLDFSDDEGLKRHLQKSKAFDKRAKEHATLKNQVEAFFEAFNKDPEEALRKLGKNPEEMAEKIIKRKIEEMEKSPEQVEREKMQKELEDLRNEKKKAETEKQQLEMEKLRNQYAAEIESEISQVLDVSKSKLPKGNPKVVKRIAQTMLFALEKGYTDVKVADVIPVVEREWSEELRSYFDSSPEEMIEEMVGKHNFDRLRKKRLASRPKGQTNTVNAIKDTGKKAETEVEKPKKSYKDFFRD